MWALAGSNRRHLRCKRNALPTELSALFMGGLPDFQIEPIIAGFERLRLAFYGNLNRFIEN